MRIHTKGLASLFFSLFLLASPSMGALVQPATGATLTVAQVLELVRRDNKDLQAARYALDLGRARLEQAGRRSNPSLDLSARSDFAFGKEGEHGASIAISQAFPVSGRLLREKEVARFDVSLAEYEIADAERRLIGEVAAAAYRVLVLDRRIQSRSALIVLQAKLAATTRQRFKAAEVSQLDVSSAQLELLSLQQQRSQLQGQRALLLVAINTRIGRSPASPLEIADVLPSPAELPGLAGLEARAMEQRPDLRSAELSVGRAGAQGALARALGREDWRLGLEFSQDRQVIAGAPPQGNSRLLGVSVSIPLPMFNQNRGLLAEADAMRDQASARVDALRLGIVGEVAGAHLDATRLQSALTDYEEQMLPAAAANVGLAQQGYRQGLVPLLDVMQAQRQHAALNDSHLDLLEQYLQALVRIHTATGDYLAGTGAPAAR